MSFNIKTIAANLAAQIVTEKTGEESVKKSLFTDNDFVLVAGEDSDVKEWQAGRFKIIQYPGSLDVAARVRDKYFVDNPIFYAYYGTPKSSGGWQFGWHVGPAREFYYSFKEAAAACVAYEMERPDELDKDWQEWLNAATR